MKTKLVEYSYPTSPNAYRMGFYKSGCYSVEIRHMPGKPSKAIKGFATLAEAKAYAETLPEAWDTFTK